MNKEIKKQWVEALRSGKYNQTKHALRTRDGYCCLGVLCDVVGSDRWNGCVSGKYEYAYRPADYPYDSFVDLLPPTVRDKVDISTCGGFIDGVPDRGENTISLVGLNDAGCTFDQIADVIEYFF